MSLNPGARGVRLTAAEAARAAGGTVVGDGEAVAHGFGADSRTLTAGAAFVAIRTGHASVGEALRAGAPYAVVGHAGALPDGATGVVVEDVPAALLPLAAEVRRRLDVLVVAVTGSTGKTLTKDFTAAAMRSLGVHAAPASYNNEIGVPLVVLSCPREARVLIIEVGARRPGDIARLCEVVRPSVGIVTGIGVTHLGVFGSRDAIAHTKAELVAALPADGLAVLPSADDYLSLLSDATVARVVTVGPAGGVRVRSTGLALDGTSGTLTVGGADIDVRIPLPGRQLLHNAASAVAAAVGCGVQAARAAEAIASATVSSWRMEVSVVGGLVVVNDAYNANPESTASALRTVRELAGESEAWAVLGELAELGTVSEAEHLRIGRLAARLGYTRVVAIGDAAAAIARGAGRTGVLAGDASEAVRLVSAGARRPAHVLVKGSRVAGLEHAARLLVDGEVVV